MSNLSRAMPALAFAAALFAAGAPGIARAQDAGACTVEDIEEPALAVFRCAGGLTIEAEAVAAFDFIRPADAQATAGASLSGGAALIELETGQGGFQILTPHAIASVRGTVWVVDAGTAATSVFVVEGAVDVSRADGSDPVALAAGEGVSIAPGAPLDVLQWSPEKVAALLARFDR